MLLIYESVGAELAPTALAPAWDARAAEVDGAVVGSVDVAGIVEVAEVEYEAGIGSPEPPPPAVVDRV